jgi:predicted RNA binding protein YcfA (HicA-like mRNA interferase family)
MSYKRIKVLAALRKRGFVVLRETGPHTIIQGPAGEIIAVPRHKELNRYTVKGIGEDAGCEWNEFKKEVS